MVSIKYKCPYLDAACEQVQWCEMAVQQMWCLLRKTNSSSRRRPDPISKHINVLERTKIWSWVPTGPETKNDCAGGSQQQFNELDWDCTGEDQQQFTIHG
jgi:hypothetical protein